MTPTEVKQAADEMVEMFAEIINLRDFDGPYWEKELAICSTECAIAHCKRVIEVLERLDSGRDIPMLSAEINEHRLILSELEGRVK